MSIKHNSNTVNEHIVNDFQIGYKLPDEHEKCTDNISLINAQLIDFNPKSFDIITQVICEDDGLLDEEGCPIVGEVSMQYDSETKMVRFYFTPEEGKRVELCSYEYYIDGKLVKNIPADNVIGLCKKLQSFVNYSKDTDVNQKVFNKCGDIDSKYILGESIIDNCKIKTVIDKKKIMDLMFSAKTCNGKSPLTYKEVDDNCGGKTYTVNFETCALDGLVNIAIDGESLTNTKLFNNPTIGGGLSRCSSENNGSCGEQRILQANFTNGCGIEKVKRADGTDMPNSGKIKFSNSKVKKIVQGFEPKFNNASFCSPSDNGLVTPVDQETIRINSDTKEIYSYTFTEANTIQGDGTSNFPLKINKCGGLSNEYIGINAKEYNKAFKFGTNNMGLTTLDNGRIAIFKKNIKVGFPVNPCNNHIRGFMTMRSGTTINLVSHKVSIEFGIIPIAGIKKMTDYIEPSLGIFNHICFGGIQIPFEDGSGNWGKIIDYSPSVNGQISQAGAIIQQGVHVQAGGNSVSGQSIVHTANDVVAIDTTNLVDFDVYVKIQAPNGIALSSIKVPFVAENGGFDLTKWVDYVEVGLFGDFKLF